MPLYDDWSQFAEYGTDFARMMGLAWKLRDVLDDRLDVEWRSLCGDLAALLYAKRLSLRQVGINTGLPVPFIEAWQEAANS